MATVDKKLDKWLNNTPKDEPKERVLAMLKRFFPDNYEEKRGSHIVVKDERLIGVHGFGPEGDFDIPVSGGQRVKGWYLKQLAYAIEIIREG